MKSFLFFLVQNKEKEESEKILHTHLPHRILTSFIFYREKIHYLIFASFNSVPVWYT
jgi:hypothetical protein